jgi:hypothetical protein
LVADLLPDTHARSETSSSRTQLPSRADSGQALRRALERELCPQFEVRERRSVQHAELRLAEACSAGDGSAASAVSCDFIEKEFQS